MRVVLIRGYRDSNIDRAWGNYEYTAVSLIFASKDLTEEFKSVPKVGVVCTDAKYRRVFAEFLVPLDDEQILEAYWKAKLIAGDETKYRKDVPRKREGNRWGSAEFVSYVLTTVGFKLTGDSPFDTPNSVCRCKLLTEIR